MVSHMLPPNKEVLARAYALTESYGLNKNWFHGDALGVPVYHATPEDERVYCYCTYGFIQRAVDDLIPARDPELKAAALSKALSSVTSHLRSKYGVTMAMIPRDKDPIVGWNDRPERTLRDVNRLFREVSVAAAA